MSIRSVFVFANVLALIVLVACGGESPFSPAVEETMGAKDSSGVTSMALPAQTARDPKVTICHVPPGNPENAHEITVAQASLKAHFPHGDTLGTCEGEPPPPIECSGVCSQLEEVCCVARIDCEWTLDQRENRICVSIE